MAFIERRVAAGVVEHGDPRRGLVGENAVPVVHQKLLADRWGHCRVGQRKCSTSIRSLVS